MKRLLLVLILGAAVLAWNAPATAAPPAQSGEPRITSFTTTATQVHRDALSQRRATVPVAWTTENRPTAANLIFDQILPDGSVINVELPRLLLWVPASGNGLAAPILPPDDPTEITLRVRLVGLLSGRVYDERELTIPITAEGAPPADPILRPAIVEFNTCCPTVERADLDAGTAQVPIVWHVENRPATANLAFEQVLPDGSVVNIELPRDTPQVESTGEGAVAPVSPGVATSYLILRARLVDVMTGRVYDQRDLPVAVNTPDPPTILSFTTTAPAVNVDALANRSARVPVAWETANRPPNSNIVFEQVLPDGNVVNIELPRSDPLVPSSGQGFVAPVSPGEDAGEVVLRLRLIDLASGETYHQLDLNIPITTEPLGEPAITTFETNIGQIDLGDLLAETARVTVFWQVDNRPDGSNLVFEQVLPDGQVVNIELPREDLIVPTAGAGDIAPITPADADEVVLRLRLIDMATGATLAQRDLSIPMDRSTTAAPVFLQFDTPQVQIDRAELTFGTVQMVVAWLVENRPEGTNIVFEQVLPDGSAVNVELPRDDPLVPSNGLGAVAPVLPASGDVTIRARLVTLSSGHTLTQSEFSVPISPPVMDGVQDVHAAFQAFEHGFMVWLGDIDTIIVCFNNWDYVRYPDTWVEGETFSVDATPPDRRFQPVRGFGKVWATQPGVRDALGWALDADEQAYTATITLTGDGPDALTLQDGSQIALGETWSVARGPAPR